VIAATTLPEQGIRAATIKPPLSMTGKWESGPGRQDTHCLTGFTHEKIISLPACGTLDSIPSHISTSWPHKIELAEVDSGFPHLAVRSISSEVSTLTTGQDIDRRYMPSGK